VTKASLQRQRVDFNQQVLMAVLHPDALPLTEEKGKAHVLQGVPPPYEQRRAGGVRMAECVQ